MIFPGMLFPLCTNNISTPERDIVINGEQRHAKIFIRTSGFLRPGFLWTRASTIITAAGVAFLVVASAVAAMFYLQSEELRQERTSWPSRDVCTLMAMQSDVQEEIVQVSDELAEGRRHSGRHRPQRD